MNVSGRLRRALELLLDAVLPPRERTARTKRRSPEDIPLAPTAHELLGTTITTLMDYSDSAVQDLIRSLKYDASVHAAQLAAALLADYLREELAASHAFSAKRVLLVPVPLHASRVRERGFNQIEAVLRELPDECKYGPLSYMSEHALARIRATSPQTKLSRQERLSNVAGAFEVTDAGAMRMTRIFLIDDVTTTGATLVNAATPLKRAGAEVSLVALARA